MHLCGQTKERQKYDKYWEIRERTRESRDKVGMRILRNEAVELLEFSAISGSYWLMRGKVVIIGREGP